VRKLRLVEEYLKQTGPLRSFACPACWSRGIIFSTATE
jgi:hypothetical protein